MNNSSTSKVFYFGEKIDEYGVRVLNEREIRASAGILFLFAIISFLNSWLVGDFTITKIFVTIFLIDFFIRIFINPKYSPSLIMGRLAVRNQQVEYVGAPQKRFAWSIGFGLAVVMFYLIVIQNIIGPLNLFICLTCLVLLFFESAFGVCLACVVYNFFHKERSQLCPGNSCAIEERVSIQRISPIQTTVVLLFLALAYKVSTASLITESGTDGTVKSEEDCVVPAYAIAMGHEEKWKLHNGCAPSSPIEEEKVAQPAPVEEDCVVPDYAIAMGHEEKWKLHNGCK